ncbi:MAG: 2-isopropylmalate synthase [Acetanaerobacterium sp.]
MERKIYIFDTTLRDGEQSPGCSMNLEEKIEIARQLERLRVDVIEAGFAISSKGDFESIETIAKTVKDCAVASLSRALEKDIDAAYEAVKKAQSPLIHTFIATSPIHMQYKLRMAPDKVLEQAEAMVAYAKKYCSDVEFSCEDATRSELQFLATVVQKVIAAGATVVNLPDTVGYTTPEEMYALIEYLTTHVDNIDRARLSVHCHNDLGMGVANSLAGVRAGASQVECTINGLGERAGNAALEEVVMAIHTRSQSMGCYTGIDTTQITKASRLIYNTIGVIPPLNKAIVGKNAFAHESGIHQHGVAAERTTYEIMTPESIGLKKNKMVLGKHSGRHAFVDQMAEWGYELSPEEIDVYFAQFKELCDKKKEVTRLDLEAIVSSRTPADAGGYKLSRFDVHASNFSTASSVVRLEKDGEEKEEVAIGDGPIDASFNAITKVTGAPEHSLEDYAIRSVGEGRDALGEVMVKIRSGDRIYTGRGLSTDIIEASLLAYLNAVNKLLRSA